MRELSTLVQNFIATEPDRRRREPLENWMPETSKRAPEDSFFGIDRSVDPVRLSGATIARLAPWRTRIYRAWRALLGDFG